MLVITEKQYESIDILLGRLTEADEPFQSEQLSFFETNTSEILASVLFFFAKQNRLKPCLQAVLPIAYYTIPRTIREL